MTVHKQAHQSNSFSEAVVLPDCDVSVLFTHMAASDSLCPTYVRGQLDAAFQEGEQETFALNELEDLYTLFGIDPSVSKDLIEEYLLAAGCEVPGALSRTEMENLFANMVKQSWFKAIQVNKEPQAEESQNSAENKQVDVPGPASQTSSQALSSGGSDTRTDIIVKDVPAHKPGLTVESQQALQDKYAALKELNPNAVEQALQSHFEKWKSGQEQALQEVLPTEVPSEYRSEHFWGVVELVYAQTAPPRIPSVPFTEGTTDPDITAKRKDMFAKAKDEDVHQVEEKIQAKWTLVRMQANTTMRSMIDERCTDVFKRKHFWETFANHLGVLPSPEEKTSMQEDSQGSRDNARLGALNSQSEAEEGSPQKKRRSDVPLQEMQVDAIYMTKDCAGKLVTVEGYVLARDDEIHTYQARNTSARNATEDEGTYFSFVVGRSRTTSLASHCLVKVKLWGKIATEAKMQFDSIDEEQLAKVRLENFRLITIPKQSKVKSASTDKQDLVLTEFRELHALRDLKKKSSMHSSVHVVTDFQIPNHAVKGMMEPTSTFVCRQILSLKSQTHNFRVTFEGRVKDVIDGRVTSNGDIKRIFKIADASGNSVDCSALHICAGYDDIQENNVLRLFNAVGKLQPDSGTCSIWLWGDSVIQHVNRTAACE